MNSLEFLLIRANTTILEHNLRKILVSWPEFRCVFHARRRSRAKTADRRDHMIDRDRPFESQSAIVLDRGGPGYWRSLAIMIVISFHDRDQLAIVIAAALGCREAKSVSTDSMK